MAGKALGAFLDAVGGVAADKAVDYFTKARDTADSPGYGEGFKGKVHQASAQVGPQLAGEIAKYGAPIATAAAGGALLAGGTALVTGVAPGEKPRSDYYVGMGSPIDQLAMRQMGAAESIEQKLMADLVRTQAHAALADRKFEHQMALQQHRQDAMTPRNQPMAGGGDLNYVMNTANRIFGGTPSY
jgi:hypothetical protein